MESYQRDTALQRTGGADILAEAGQGIACRIGVPQGDGHHKYRQHGIFQPGQPAGPLSLFDLFHGDLVQQFLDKPEGAEKAADQPPQSQAQQQQNPHNV